MFRFPFLSSRNKQEGEAKAGSSAVGTAAGKDPHGVELDQFKAVLESFGATRINDRLAVLDAFLATEQHVTITELEQHLRAKGPTVCDRFFVQETIDTMFNPIRIDL